MSGQKIFKNSYVERLKTQLFSPHGIDRYLNGDIDHPDSETWLKTDLLDISETGLKLEAPKTSQTGDLDNAIAIYRAWKNMTPTQATDHRLWAYLCHVPFMPYLKVRRPIEDVEPKKRVQFILDHWFVENPGPSALKSNDIYLFWWASHITYDEDRDDHFELTRELFSMLDYTRHLLPGYQGRSRAFAHAVLEFVVENQDIFARYKEAKVRLVMRKLNLLAGYKALATLPKDTIKRHIEGFRSEIVTAIDPDVLKRPEKPKLKTDV